MLSNSLYYAIVFLLWRCTSRAQKFRSLPSGYTQHNLASQANEKGKYCADLFAALGSNGWTHSYVALMERRQHERYDLQTPLSFSWKGARGVRYRREGLLRNISGGGVFVVTREVPPVGSEVRFSVSIHSVLAWSRLVLQATVSVVRADPTLRADTLPGFGAAMKSYTLRNETEVLEKNVLGKDYRENKR